MSAVFANLAEVVDADGDFHYLSDSSAVAFAAWPVRAAAVVVVTAEPVVVVALGSAAAASK